MENIFSLLIQTVFWYFIFRLVMWLASAWNAAKEEQHNEIVTKFNEITHIVKKEYIDGQEYWFDQHDDEFLAQGRTQEEIIDKLKSRFPDHYFFLEDKSENVFRICAPNWKVEPHRVG